MQRRHFLALSAPAILGLAACSTGDDTGGAAASDGGGAEGPFSYTPEGYDDLTIELDQIPQSIVADIYSAAALQPYGIEFAGVFGFGKDGSGKGDLDLEAENVLGYDGNFSLEKLAAAAPDIIIGVGNEDGSGWTWWDEKVAEQATEVAPYLPVNMGGTPPEMMEQYQKIAKALGADISSDEQTAAQDEFEAARERIRTVAEEKDSLTILAMNTDGEAIWTSDSLGVIQMLADDGLTFVGPETPEDEAWAESTWETISDYESDVVLIADTSAGYEENPLWTSLPAVEADQVGTWDDKRAYSYSVQTAWLNELADLLEKAEDIVS